MLNLGHPVTKALRETSQEAFDSNVSEVAIFFYGRKKVVPLIAEDVHALHQVYQHTNVTRLKVYLLDGPKIMIDLKKPEGYAGIDCAWTTAQFEAMLGQKTNQIVVFCTGDAWREGYLRK